MEKIVYLMVVVCVIVSTAFSMSASPKVSTDISKVIETNSDQPIRFDWQHCYQQGYITGITTVAKDAPGQSADPVSEIRFENVSDKPIRLDGIFLNKAGFVFNYEGFRHKYNIKDKLHLDQMQQVFWDTYACVHHGQPSGAYYKASMHNMPRIWNVFGYGVCYWTNEAMGDFLNYAGVDIRQASAYGHFVKEYWIDDKWVLFDFNQKGYYRSLDGEIASQDEIFDDPYLVFAQNTFGPLEHTRMITEAAVRLQCPPSILTKQARKEMKTQRPFYSEAKDYDSTQEYTGADSVMMSPGDAVSFTNLPVRHNVLDAVENSWGRANMFVREGSFSLETIPILLVDKKYEIKKKLPFIVNEVEISFDADNFDGPLSHITVSSVNPNQRLAFILGGRQGSKIYFKANLVKSTDNIHLVFKPVIVQGESPSFKNLNVKLNFFYNSRMLWDIKPDSNLHLVADKNASVKTTIRLNPDYKNSFYDTKESCSVKSKDSHVIIDISSHKQPQYYEYYLANENADYPVATGWYFVDKTGQRDMPLECLPTDKYNVHFRCYYPSRQGLGYWSKWKTSDPFHIDNTKKDIALKFSQSNGKLYAAAADADTKGLEVVISENKFFPVRDGQPFMGKSGEPLGNEIFDDTPEHYARMKITKGTSFEWPKWASYYRIVKDGQAVSKLQHTQSVLSDKGFVSPENLVDNGLTLTINYRQTPIGPVYKWAVDDSFKADKITAVISKQGEFGYKTTLPFLLRLLTDTKSKPKKSTLILYEDGKPLPLSHSIHADINSLGLGRYSCYQDDKKYWVQLLYFSTSDNTDPILNGRKYEFRSKDLQHSVEVIFKYDN